MNGRGRTGRSGNTEDLGMHVLRPETKIKKKLLLHHLQLVYLVDRKSTIFNQDTYLQGQGPDLSPSDKIDENGKIK